MVDNIEAPADGGGAQSSSSAHLAARGSSYVRAMTARTVVLDCHSTAVCCLGAGLGRIRAWRSTCSKAAWAFRRRHWWARPPFLPLPDAEYLRWRMYTAYADEAAVPPVDDVDPLRALAAGDDGL